MSWNYRVIKSHWKLKKLKGTEFSLREVYYDENGRPTSWSADPSYLCSESVGDMRGDLMLMRKAFDLPILEVVIEDGKEYLTEHA